MKAILESDILNEAFRKAVIAEITRGEEARARKEEHERREQVYKDGTREYAARLVQLEMGNAAVLEMQHRIPNISITKKIVNKKARVYKDTPVRKAVNEVDQPKLDAIAKYLKLDSWGKKINRKVELHQNMEVRVLPYENKAELDSKGTPTWDIKLALFHAGRYDVIEDPNDPTTPLAVILSYVDLGGGLLRDYRSTDSTATKIAEPEGGQARAAAIDPKKQRFVWWSKNYHFTTDEAGKIIGEGTLSPEDGKNPFGTNAFIPYSKDQGEGYWTNGGDGLAGNAILINLLLGDLNFSAKYQGTGLGYIICENPPTEVRMGANRFIKIPQKEGETKAQVGFASPDPKLQEAMSIIEQQLAFFLTTEGLEAGAITGKLDATNVTSGIHAVIEKSEPVAAVEDDQQLYRDQEPKLVQTVCTMVEALRRMNLPLCKELAEINLPAELPYALSFSSAKPTLSESERVDVVSKKQKLGLYLDKELLQELHPELDEKAVDEKLKALTEEKKAKAALAPAPAPDPNAPPKAPPQGA